MIPVETLAAFFAASLVLALAPGPDNIFVLTQSALFGKISGIFVMFGLCTGLIVHTAAVALGVAIIFQHRPSSSRSSGRGCASSARRGSTAPCDTGGIIWRSKID